MIGKRLIHARRLVGMLRDLHTRRKTFSDNGAKNYTSMKHEMKKTVNLKNNNDPASV